MSELEKSNEFREEDSLCVDGNEEVIQQLVDGMGEEIGSALIDRPPIPSFEGVDCGVEDLGVLEKVRGLLMSPSVSNWMEILRLIRSGGRAYGGRVVYDYVAEHLDSWPDEIREICVMENYLEFPLAYRLLVRGFLTGGIKLSDESCAEIVEGYPYLISLVSEGFHVEFNKLSYLRSLKVPKMFGGQMALIELELLRELNLKLHEGVNLDGVPNLVKLVIDRGFKNLDDEDLLRIQGLKKLRELILIQSLGEGSNLDILSDLPELESMNLYGGNDTWFRGLEKFTRLKRLRLFANSVFQFPKQLQFLEFKQVNDYQRFDVNNLVGLDCLEELKLTIGWKMENIERLASLPKLRKLTLVCSSYPKSFDFLNDIPSLKFLVLEAISKNFDFSRLANLSDLERLEIGIEDFDENDNEKENEIIGLLKMMLPEAEIIVREREHDSYVE